MESKDENKQDDRNSQNETDGLSRRLYHTLIIVLLFIFLVVLLLLVFFVLSDLGWVSIRLPVA